MTLAQPATPDAYDPLGYGAVPDLALADAATLDVTAIDRRLRSISTVEDGWSLPRLPANTKLDLAQQDTTPEALGGFLWGLVDDLNRAVNPLAASPAGAATGNDLVPDLPYDTDPGSFQNELRRQFAGWAGQPAPKVISPTSVRYFKQRAKSLGLLPTDFPDDESWTPELNSVQYEMMRNDFQDRMSGDRPGSVTMDQVGKFMGDWLTPSGLLSAAVDLDLLPDIPDFSQKLTKFTEDPSAKNLLGVLWGGAIDIALPIVNTALLFSGVSQVYLFARATKGATMAADAGRFLAGGSKWMSLSDKVWDLGRTYDVARDVQFFQRPSFMAQKLMAPSTRAATAGRQASVSAESMFGLGNQMTQWRQYRSVMVAKKATQAGMRLGVLSRLEHMLPGVEGVHTSPRDLGITDSISNVRSLNPMLGAVVPMVFDTAFAPIGMFAEGAFVGPIKAAAAKAKAGLAVVPESQAGFMMAQRIREHLPKQASAYWEAGEHELAARAETMHARFNEVSAKNGEAAALVDLFGGDARDADTAGGIVTHLIASAAVNSAADNVVGTALKGTQPAVHGRRWWQTKAKMVRQLRHIEEGDYRTWADVRAGLDETPDGMVTAGARATGNSHTAKRIGEKARQNLARINNPDPVVAAKWRAIADAEIFAHNEKRIGFWHDLLGQLTPEAFDNVIVDSIRQVDNWHSYQSGMHEVRAAVGTGLLDGTSFAPKVVPYEKLTDEASNAFDPLVAGLLTPEELRYVHIDALSPGPEQMTGRFTLMGLDTPTKQDAISFSNTVRRALRRRDTLVWLFGTETQRGRRDVLEGFVTPFAARIEGSGRKAHEIGYETLNAWADELGGELGGFGAKKRKEIISLLRWASHQGVDVQGARAMVAQQLTDLERSPVWFNWFRLTGEGPLEDMAKALRAKSQYIASEVADAPKDLADFLHARGYKLVHGVEFLGPDDTMNLPGIFEEMTAANHRRITLGAFFARQPYNDSFRKALAQETKSNLSKNLIRARQAGLLDPAVGGLVLHPESTDIDDIVYELTAVAMRKRQVLGESADTASGPLEKLAENFKSSGAPFNISDLKWDDVKKAFAGKWGENGARAIWQSVKAARKSQGWHERGLLALEDHLVSRSYGIPFLQLLAGTDMGLAAQGRLTSAGTRRVAGGLLAGAAVGYSAESAGQDPNPLMVAGGVGLGAALGPRLLEGEKVARAAARAVPAVIGATAAGAAGGGEGGALAGALAGGLLGPKAVRPAAQFGLKQITAHPNWVRYSYLGEGLRQTRDLFRFRLRPFFDLSRYTEGATLAQLEDVPAGVTLPFRMNLKHFERTYGRDAARNARAGFQAASRGEFDLEAVDFVQQAFESRGILGFNPTEYMTSAFGHLVQQGVEPEQAYHIARQIYTYGTEGRSAAELSVNFIFFPFSFQKKMLTTATKFLSHDLSRVAFLHDSMKTYDLLNEEFDLSTIWEEHLPVLRQFQKLNSFARGISPGELGGINRPLIEAGLALDPGVVPAVLNAFLPQGVQIRSKDDAKAIEDLMKRLAPVRNDIHYLLEDLKEQQHVLMSPQHQTTFADVRDGWQSWNAMKTEASRLAIEAGLESGYDGLIRSERPDLAPAQEYLKAQKAELMRRYPGWADSINSSITRRADEQTEIDMRRYTPRSQGDMELRVYAEFEAQMEEYVTSLGLSFGEGYEDLPPEVFTLMRQRAIELAATGNGFERLYKKFWARRWGPIQFEVY